MHLDILKEEELKATLKRVMASEKANDELKKQAGKLVRVMELFNVRNFFFIVVGISLLLYIKREYIIACAILIVFIVACFAFVALVDYRCKKIIMALDQETKQALSSD